jgi:hypothetical protein
MKKVSNKYVNFGIAFALLGILVFSLIMTPLEGFKEAVKTDTEETDTKTEKKSTTKPSTPSLSADKMKELQKMLNKISSNSSDSKEGFSYINESQEPLSNVLHLGHFSNDKKEQSKLV